MKNLILCLIAVCSVGFLAACSCDERHEENTSASMLYDSKDMTPHHHHHTVDTDNQ